MTIRLKSVSFCLSQFINVRVLLLALSLGFASYSFATSGFAEELKPDRFEKEIKAIERAIESGSSRNGSVLFVGSSSIKRWKLDESFPKLNAANHGFGGSHLSDSVHFFDRIVTPIAPSTVILYAGDNDIASGKSPESVAKDFQAFVDLTESKLHDCQMLIYIGIKPSTKRWALREKIQAANSKIKAICEANPKLQFVDVWQPMLGDNGEPRPNLLVEDGLHMTDQGYVIWARLLSEHLPSAPADTEAKAD